ncbi:GTPase IMAP family member 6-like [Molossus nigricans]
MQAVFSYCSYARDALFSWVQTGPPGACDESAPEGETENSQEHRVEKEEFKLIDHNCPKGALSQNPEQDVSGDLREKKQTPQRLRLMLVGKTGSGKSAIGNSILGRDAFESKLSSRPLTQTFQRGSRDWAEKEIEVIDTPDFLSPSLSQEVATRGSCEAISFSSPGPHAVLLVTQLGRYTKEDQEVVRRLQEVFGVGILAYTILVFTRKEDLDGGSLDEYVKETDNRELAKLDVLCERRHCGFNNRAQGPEQEAQLEELMTKIEAVLWENEGRRYSNRAYQCAQQSPLSTEVQGRPIFQGRASEEGPSGEDGLEDLCRVQKESEEAHKRLLKGALI